MVVEVITESLDVGDVFVATLRGQVSGEQNYMLVSEAAHLNFCMKENFPYQR